MGFFSKIFGRRERAEDTLRWTKTVMDRLAAGDSDEDAARAAWREGAGVERARELVAEVKQVRQRYGRG